MSHITHFSIQSILFNRDSPDYEVVVFLDASAQSLLLPTLDSEQDQACLTVCQGPEKKCKRFIKRKLRWQSISQWIGYLVAGGLGAVLTYLFQLLKT